MGELSESVENLKEEKALKLIRERIEADVDPVEILEDCREGMRGVGARFERKEYFHADLIMAAEIFQEGMDFIIPKLKTGEAEPLGKIVIGTVKGDIHDIGKNMVTALLEAEGIGVKDLGVNILPQEFVNAVKDEKVEIVGLSGLLTQAIEPMKDTIEALEDADLRKDLKVIIGGSRMDELVCEYVKADAWVDTANEGVRICRKWIEEG